MLKPFAKVISEIFGVPARLSPRLPYKVFDCVYHENRVSWRKLYWGYNNAEYPRTRTEKSVEISLSVAKLQKPSDLIAGLDELLEILTGSKAFVGSPLLKPPPPPEPTDIIIELLRKNKKALTHNAISKQTKLGKDTAMKALNTLVEQGVIFSPKSQGWKKYALVRMDPEASIPSGQSYK